MRFHLVLCATVLVAAAFPAQATNVTLSGTLTSSCTLTLNSSGSMTASTSGTVLSSENSGGSPASLGVVAVGTLPAVHFAAPSLTASPAGWSASPTVEIKYTSTNGANAAYSASSSTFVETGLLDSFVVHGRVTNATGFAAGSYTLTTVATCS